MKLIKKLILSPTEKAYLQAFEQNVFNGGFNDEAVRERARDLMLSYTPAKDAAIEERLAGIASSQRSWKWTFDPNSSVKMARSVRAHLDSLKAFRTQPDDEKIRKNVISSKEALAEIIGARLTQRSRAEMQLPTNSRPVQPASPARQSRADLVANRVQEGRQDGRG